MFDKPFVYLSMIELKNNKLQKDCLNMTGETGTVPRTMKNIVFDEKTSDCMFTFFF